MKTCSRCKETLSLDKFSKNSKRKDALQAICQKCNAEYQKTHYKKNKDYYLEKNKKWRSSFSALLKEIKDNKRCTDCKKQYPHYVLQFDHIDSKEFTISQARYKSLESIMTEIEKCELVCANCHAERTWKRKNK